MTAIAAAPFGAVLAPGASATRDHPSLVAIERALSPAPVRRIDLPSRRADAAVVAVVAAAAAEFSAASGLAPDHLLLGGRSYGGRMCSMAVAEGLPSLGLVLVSYPLHPPGRPDKMRTAHFVSLDLPCLFVSGTRDSFATPGELAGATAAIPGPVTHVWIEGGDHGLRRRDDEVAAAVAAWATELSNKSANSA